MIRARHFCIPLALFLSVSAFCASSQTEKQFVRGSLSDKIRIMQALSEDEAVPLARKGLDFAIENVSVLESDAELSQLAVASVLAFPADSGAIARMADSDKKLISERLMAVFKLFPENTLRSAVMERLEPYSGGSPELAVAFLNDYLATAYKTNASAADVLERAIVMLGRIGDDESLSIIYSIWHSKLWPEYRASTDEALVSLSADSFSDVIRIFSVSTIEDFAHFFTLLHKSAKISENFLCETAENALSIAINNVENLKASGTDAEKAFTSFQIEAQGVLTEHRWSHAAGVIHSNLVLAKRAYDSGAISEDDFVSLVASSVRVPSPALAQSLSEMLSACNGAVGSAAPPAKSVVLALISALGDLGDKTAFDSLLSVTYLSYPPEVIDEAKLSLAKLNW